MYTCHPEDFGVGADSQMGLWATIDFSSDEPLSPSREQSDFEEMERLWDMGNINSTVVAEGAGVGANGDLFATTFDADGQQLEHTEEDTTVQDLDWESLFGWARETIYEDLPAITPSTDISTFPASNPLSSQDRPAQSLPTSVSLKDVQRVFPPSPSPIPIPPAVLAAEPRLGDVGGSQLKLTRNLDIATPLTTEDDKRRRNTAASARFRKKKRERESSLQVQREELDSRVGHLNEECAALRRENEWLKELVTSLSSEEQALLRIGLQRAASESRTDEATEDGEQKVMESEAYRSRRRRDEAEVM